MPFVLTKERKRNIIYKVALCDTIYSEPIKLSYFIAAKITEGINDYKDSEKRRKNCTIQCG